MLQLHEPTKANLEATPFLEGHMRRGLQEALLPPHWRSCNQWTTDEPRQSDGHTTAAILILTSCLTG